MKWNQPHLPVYVYRVSKNDENHLNLNTSLTWTILRKQKQKEWWYICDIWFLFSGGRWGFALFSCLPCLSVGGQRTCQRRCIPVGSIVQPGGDVTEDACPRLLCWGSVLSAQMDPVGPDLATISQPQHQVLEWKKSRSAMEALTKPPLHIRRLFCELAGNNHSNLCPLQQRQSKCL